MPSFGIVKKALHFCPGGRIIVKRSVLQAYPALLADSFRIKQKFRIVDHLGAGQHMAVRSVKEIDISLFIA